MMIIERLCVVQCDGREYVTLFAFIVIQSSAYFRYNLKIFINEGVDADVLFQRFVII
jgi:hypothetical protein